jgi:hypothetical protein
MQLTVDGSPLALGGAVDRHHSSSFRMTSAGDFSSWA